MAYRHAITSPLGELQLHSNGRAITGLYFEEHHPTPRQRGGKLDGGPFRTVEDQLEQFFAGELREFTVVVELVGTDFQRSVWSALKGIAYGCTATYAEIAQRCHRPRAVRAVGAAIGRNPISILIPCHRVVATNGSLTGFAGGLARKQWLLDNERSGGAVSASPPSLV